MLTLQKKISIIENFPRDMKTHQKTLEMCKNKFWSVKRLSNFEQFPKTSGGVVFTPSHPE